MWHPGYLSFCDHTGVLLQHAWIQLFCTLVYHLRSRYVHCSHSRSYISGATRTEGSIC